MAQVVGVEVTACIAGMEALEHRMNTAVRQIVEDAAHLIQLAGAAKAPVGTPGNSTNAPGDLGRSVSVEGPYGGDGIYEAKVGPTMIYSRQRELGGAIYAKNARYMHFFQHGVERFERRVYQHPEPYMKPARDESIEPIAVLARARVAEAIVTPRG